MANIKAFCASDKVRQDAASFCKFDSFVKHLKDYCKEKNLALEEPVTLDMVYAATGLTIERDTYRAFPGKRGNIHKSTWLVGLAIVADEAYATQLETMCEFLDGNTFVFDTSKYVKFADFLTCFDGFRLRKRIASFKPSARLLKDICVRYNLALESSGVREGVKGKYLLGLDFA